MGIRVRGPRPSAPGPWCASRCRAARLGTTPLLEGPQQARLSPARAARTQKRGTLRRREVPGLS
jgi:hypothetical protein